MTGSSVINRKIILEDGTEYCGSSFGAEGDRILEIVFNTSVTGYQEIMSDPSYTDQAVVMTYPLIGNYGMAEEDYESLSPSVGALCSLSLASPSQSGVSAEVRRAFRVPKSLIDLFSFLVSTPLIPAMPKRSIT